MSSVEELNSKIIQLQKENEELKDRLQIETEKDLHHQETIAKIKEIHSEYETTYLNSISESKARENALKNQYLQYQAMLDSQYSQNEKRQNEEIQKLKKIIKSKNETIANQSKIIFDLKQAIVKSEIENHIKEKDFENLLIAKDRKMNEYEEELKKISKEGPEDIKNLKERLEILQEKIQSGETEKNDNFYYGFSGGNSPEENKESTINTIDVNSLSSQIPSQFPGSQVQTSCTYPSPSHGINQMDLINEVGSLQREIQMLAQQLEEKEREVELWKNVRNNMTEYNNHAESSIENYYNLKTAQLENTVKQFGLQISQLKRDYELSQAQHKKEVEQLKEAHLYEISQLQMSHGENKKTIEDYLTYDDYNNEIGKSQIIGQKINELNKKFENENYDNDN